jgi:hypothetical protein
MNKSTYALALALLMFVFSCQHDDSNQLKKGEVPSAIVSKLQAAGFDTSEGLMPYKDGYLVEYDILLTEEQIDELLNSHHESTARVEHYRTTNLVTGTPRTLGVYMDVSFGAYMQNSFDAALARYNNENTGLKFQRVSSQGAAQISILSFYEVSSTLGFSAGFPTGGNPASPIRLNTYFYNDNSQRGDATTVIAHEIGHAIGFRHTDFSNRSFSCGGQGGNEGSAGVGAVHIPGTPTTPSAGSWMLACSNGGDRPFTSSDKVALKTVYPLSTGGTGVKFFKDANYAGTVTSAIPKGNYTLGQLQAYGFVNDWASSMQVPSGWTVILYQHNDFGGTSWTFTGNNPNFTTTSGLNDQVTSVRIQ